jgi:dipeptidyl aminopeptidase/acylaminoacyl peptidase
MNTIKNEPVTKRAFEVDDLFRFQYAAEAQLSPDGRYAVYVLMRTDESKGEEFSNLWLIDLESNKTTQLTFGMWADYQPAWSPDGNSIAFLSSREEKPQIYLMSVHGGEANKLTSFSQGCAGPLLWSPDGSRLAFCAGIPNPRDASLPYRVTRTVYRFDGAGYVDRFVKQIHVLDLSDGNTAQLTTDDWNHTPVSWSPDGKEILFLASLNPDSIFTSPSIRAMDLQGSQRTILTNEWGIIQNAVWLSDGRLAFAGVPAGNLYGTKSDLWVMNPDGSNVECRTASIPNGINGHLHDDTPALWSFSPPPILPSPDGTEAIVNVQSGGEMHICQISLKGREEARVLANGERFCFPFNRTGKEVLFGISTLFDPTQLLILDIASGKESQLTSLNQDLLAEIQLPKLQNIHFKSIDGADVEGWLMTPLGEAPFPTVLHIHGGPHVAYGNAFYFDFLTLAGAGFAVLFANHRGSTGYGNAFATGTHADWGNLDYHDLMAAVDYTIALGIADPERLGCCGVSGGGYLSCWIVGHTDRFKAAVPENPVTNFVSFYGTGDIGPVFAVREMGGKPYEVPETYMRCSPITYAHHCKTPTLLVVGENDYRCPAEQAEQFYTTLKANGCTVEMLRFPNSSHDGATIGSFATRRAHNEALVEWMSRYLVGKTE